MPTVGPSSVPSPPNCAGTVLNGNYPDYADTRLISPEITLTPSSGGFPGLYFWHWFRINENSVLGSDGGYIQVSVNGDDWVNLAGPFSGIATVWTQAFVDLNSYANQKVRIAWFFTSGGSYVDNGWYIDDVRFEGIITVAPTISGNVTSGGSGLENVEITGLPGDPATNASGDYSVTVDQGWSGTAVPVLAGFSFYNYYGK